MSRRLSSVTVLLALILTACGGEPAAPPDPPDPASAAEPGAPAEAPPDLPPWFEETAVERGLVFDHVSGTDGSRLLFPEIMGGGAALADLDGDGDLDAYLVQSGSLHEPGSDAGRNRLFENEGGGRFRDRTDVSGADDAGYGNGVAVGDYDNDGDLDLYVTNFGPNALLENDGGGRFTERGAAAGVDDPGWGTSAGFFDYDGDGFLDLFVVNYVDWSETIERECYSGTGVPDYCLPTNYNAPAQDRLFRNLGDGTFEDVTREAGLQAAFGNGLGVVVADFDDDGRPDVFVANDTMMNQLWLNRDGEGFVDEALLRGCALDEHGTAKAGMGIVSEDLDGDADDDVIVVNMHGQTDSVFRNDGGMFTDATAAFGLSGITRRFTRFGLGLADFDNDGLSDLYQANGGVMKATVPGDDPYVEENVLLRGTPSGRFEEVRPRGGTPGELLATSRAAAFGDVDDDGGVDVLVVNRDGPAHLLRNVVANRGGWVRMRVLDEHGRDAYGARLAARVGERTVHRVVRSAYSYHAASDPRLHLGLADAAGVDTATVRWPDGAAEVFGPLAADRDHVLRRGEGRPAAP